MFLKIILDNNTIIYYSYITFAPRRISFRASGGVIILRETINAD